MLTGCAPGHFFGEPPKIERADIRVEPAKVFTEIVSVEGSRGWEWGGPFKLGGAQRHDELARELAAVFEEAVISELREAGFEVNQTQSVDAVLVLQLEMFYKRRFYDHLVAESIKGFSGDNTKPPFEIGLVKVWFPLAYTRAGAVRRQAGKIIRDLVEKMSSE
jgi:hypothetical protein